MSDALFDREELLERVGGDESLCRELVTLFLSDSPNAINRLRQALADNDLTKIEREAHSIKGAAAYISARSIQSIATSLELAAREHRADEVATRVEEIEQEIARLAAFTG